MTPRPRVYIAGPISIGNQFHNCAKAIHVATDVVRMGCAPYVPHLTCLWDMVNMSLTYEDWLQMCFDWIPTCHALLRVPGESPGADKEVAFAMSLGIPVFYSVEQLAKGLDFVRNPERS